MHIYIMKLNMVVNDMKAKGLSPIYLVTDHIGFYEKYGWEFLCMVQGDGEPNMTRMYIHRYFYCPLCFIYSTVYCPIIISCTSN